MRREFVRQRFVFLLFFSALLCFNETERNFSESRFDFDWIWNFSSLSFHILLSLSFLGEQYKVVSVVEEIKMKLLKICHNKLPQWRHIFPSLSPLSSVILAKFALLAFAFRCRFSIFIKIVSNCGTVVSCGGGGGAVSTKNLTNGPYCWSSFGSASFLLQI